MGETQKRGKERETHTHKEREGEGEKAREGGDVLGFRLVACVCVQSVGPKLKALGPHLMRLPY